MHALHKILVRINGDGIHDLDRMAREEIMDDARYTAASATEDFNQAYDWRETDTAGRWDDVYPENVLLSSDNIDSFIGEILDCKSKQQAEIDVCVKRIKEGLGSMDLQSIIDRNTDTIRDYSLLYELKLIAELLSGEYVFDSMFFDADYYTAKITEDTINKVRQSPNDWALVMFDCHI